MIGTRSQSFQDPVYILRQMGCELLYDYRVMDKNLIKNLAAPDVVLGAEPADLYNGGMEGVYGAGGQAPNWYKNPSAVGTYQSTSDFPWASDGIAAQEVINETLFNTSLLSQAFTTELGRTYKISFKAQVTAGTLRVRMVDYTPFIHYGWIELTSADLGENYEHYFYYQGFSSVDVQLQFFSAGVPLSFKIDDLKIEAVDDDLHMMINPAAWDSGTYDYDYYEYSGAGYDYATNWNVDNHIDLSGGNFVIFDKMKMTINGTYQAQYDASGSKKVFILRAIDSGGERLELITSQDGTTQNSWQSDVISDLLTSMHSIVLFYTTSGIELYVDGVQVNGSYSGGSHQATLYNAAQATYLHNAYRNVLGNFPWKGKGKAKIKGLIIGILSEQQKKLLIGILDAYK